MASNCVLDKVRALVCTPEKGERMLVVLYRGWIFAGHMSFNESTGLYTLNNCKNVRTWKTGGFGGLSRSAKDSGAVLDPCANIVFRADASIFCVPIKEDWDA